MNGNGSMARQGSRLCWADFAFSRSANAARGHTGRTIDHDRTASQKNVPGDLGASRSKEIGGMIISKRRDRNIAAWLSPFLSSLLTLATIGSAAESASPLERSRGSGANLPVYSWDGSHRYLLFINSASDNVVVLVTVATKESHHGYFVSEAAMRMVRSMAPATLEEFDISITPTIIDGHRFYSVKKKGRHVPV
jgi:hypothetical protein